MNTIEPVSRSDVKHFIEKHHYSHNINGIKSTYCFAIYDSQRVILGACIFGMLSTTAWKRYGLLESDVIELRRLVILPESDIKLSQFVSQCIKYLKKNKACKLIVSYADPYHDHHGGIYQATNFFFLGKTSSDKGLKDKFTGKIYHSRAMRTKYKGKLKPFAKRLTEQYQRGEIEEIVLPGKYIYAYPLVRKERKRLKAMCFPYPKPKEFG